MISLEQIKELESRVHTAVGRIRTLTAENATLKERLSSYETRVGELEELVNAFKSEQQEIEAGIIAALRQLDGLEDVVADAPSEESDTGDDADAAVTNAPEPAISADAPPVEAASDEEPFDEVDEDAVPDESAEPETEEADEEPGSASEPEARSPGARSSMSPVPPTPPTAEIDEEEPELDIF